MKGRKRKAVAKKKAAKPKSLVTVADLKPAYRGRHIGGELVKRLQPDYIRSKSDQSTGDPTSFYKKLGYEVTERHAGRKRNINIMRRRQAAGES